jgi:hypothetical protein
MRTPNKIRRTIVQFRIAALPFRPEIVHLAKRVNSFGLAKHNKKGRAVGRKMENQNLYWIPQPIAKTERLR